MPKELRCHRGVCRYENTSKITRANPFEYGIFLPHQYQPQFFGVPRQVEALKPLDPLVCPPPGKNLCGHEVDMPEKDIEGQPMNCFFYQVFHGAPRCSLELVQMLVPRSYHVGLTTAFSDICPLLRDPFGSPVWLRFLYWSQKAPEKSSVGNIWQWSRMLIELI